MLSFTDEDQLRSWLKTNPQGQTIIEESVPSAAKHVLLVQRSDCVEIYGPRSVFTKVVTRIHAPLNDRLTDEILDTQLSPMWKEMHVPRRLLSIVKQKRITPQEHEWWQCFRGNLKEMDNVVTG